MLVETADGGWLQGRDRKLMGQRHRYKLQQIWSAAPTLELRG